MRKILLTLVALLMMTNSAKASDSIAAGIRTGTASGDASYFTELFADLYLNRLISIGATFAYVSEGRHLVRDESIPVTALFKLHAPTKLVQPYAGLGAAMVFHSHLPNNGTPVMLLGLDVPLGGTPLFINGEYRHNFNGSLNMLSGGVGLKF